ncbi:hypothetical protein ES703_31530 [subsurface metagenome]
MELGQAKALGVLNEHDRGIGDVDPHLNDRGGDQDVHLLILEVSHYLFLLITRHLAMNETDFEVREDLRLKMFLHFGGGL